MGQRQSVVYYTVHFDDFRPSESQRSNQSKAHLLLSFLSQTPGASFLLWVRRISSHRTNNLSSELRLLSRTGLRTWASLRSPSSVHLLSLSPPFDRRKLTLFFLIDSSLVTTPRSLHTLSTRSLLVTSPPGSFRLASRRVVLLDVFISSVLIADLRCSVPPFSGSSTLSFTSTSRATRLPTFEPELSSLGSECASPS